MVGNVSTHGVFSGAQFGSGELDCGTGAPGGISISGVITPVRAACIYWAMITEGAAPAADKKIMVQGLSPTPASAIVPVAGTPAGDWWHSVLGRQHDFSFSWGRAEHGGDRKWDLSSYAVCGRRSQHRWRRSVGRASASPYGGRVHCDCGYRNVVAEGRHLTTGDWQARLSMAIPGISYSLTLPAATTGTLTLFESIGADGQHGVSRTADAGLGDESTVSNSVYLAGPLSANNDSCNSDPSPQSWDDVGQHYDRNSVGDEGPGRTNCQRSRIVLMTA